MVSYLSPDPSPAAALVALGLPQSKADRLVEAFPGLQGLASATVANVTAAAGLTARQAGAVVAAFRLARLASHCGDGWRDTVRHPDAFAACVRSHIGSEASECFVVAYLDARQRVIDLVLVHRGTLSQVDVHPREVFRPAVRAGAHSVIVAHNHPSGDASPSEADVTLTKRLADAGRMMGIPLLDHLVVTPTSHVSMTERGLV